MHSLISSMKHLSKSVLVIIIAIILHSEYGFTMEPGDLPGKCKTGHWTQITPDDEPNYRMRASKVRFNFSEDSTTNGNKWIEDACSIEYILYSCYYHNNPLARTLEMRRWVADDENCVRFWPHEFLTSIRGKRIFMFGDSLMQQLFMGLICTLKEVTTHQIRMQWLRNKHYNELICPFGPPHCHASGGLAKFHAANTTIIFESVVGSPPKTCSFKHLMGFFVSKHFRPQHDVIFLNHALHCHHQDEYKTTLDLLVDEIETYDNSIPIPPILYLKPFPQHFDNQSGLYESSGHYQINYNDPTCHKYENEEKTMQELNWRNVYLHNALYNHSKFRMIAVDGLYSQYDAHVAYAGVNGTRFAYAIAADCTHWCYPSGIFDYAFRMIYNAMIEMKIVSYPQRFNITLGLRDYAEGTILRGMGKSIFIIKDGKKHQFQGMQSFLKMGLDFDNVVVIPQYEMEDIPTGDPIPEPRD